MTVKGVRRDKAALSSGCKPHPAMDAPTRSFAVDQLSRSITIGFNPFALWPSQYSTPGEGEESPRIATPFFPGGREMREFFRRRDPLPRDRRL